MLSIRTVLSLFLLMLMGSLFVAHAEGRHVDGDEGADTLRAAIADMVPGGQRPG